MWHLTPFFFIFVLRYDSIVNQYKSSGTSDDGDGDSKSLAQASVAFASKSVSYTYGIVNRILSNVTVDIKNVSIIYQHQIHSRYRQHVLLCNVVLRCCVDLCYVVCSF